MIKWLMKRFNDWITRPEREQAAEEAHWDHMFFRLWESRNKRIDEAERIRHQIYDKLR